MPRPERVRAVRSPADHARIEPFAPPDQAAAKALILAGMLDHWGHVDPTLNPDLDDIAESYEQGVFLVGRLDGRLVATGALLPERTPDRVVRIVRMSVAADLRRDGIGRLMLDQLCAQAAAGGASRIVLETTEGWDDVIAFYRHAGFVETHREQGRWSVNVGFALDL